MNKLLIIAAALLILCGCFQTYVNITVNKDGSGELKRTVLWKSDTIDMLKSLAQDSTSSMQMSEFDDNPDLFKAQAAKLGEGVTFKSSRTVEQEGYKGWEAIYSFANVEGLRISDNPVTVAMDPDSLKTEELISFKYDKKQKLLKITRPQSNDESVGALPDSAAADTTGRGTAEELTRMFYTGMKVGYYITFANGIEQTNALFRKGDTITLMDIDFDVLLTDPQAYDKLEEIPAAGPGDAEQFRKIMDKLPGIQADDTALITVKGK